MYAKFSAFMIGLALAASSMASPLIQHWQTPNGAQVLFVEDHDLPMLDLAVNFPAGSARDTAAQSGLASLTHGLLDHGAAGLTEEEIARKLADVGAQLNGSFDPDRAAVILRTLSQPRERNIAVDILARVVQQPTFPAEILAREKARVIAGLQEAETKPETLAGKAFQRAVFGAHPYALPTGGEAASVATLQVEDVRTFYRTHYTAGGALVAIMGDVSRSDAEAIARQLTENLPQGAPVTPLPPVALNIAASEQRIDHPAKQSHLLLGAPGMARTDPDYFALYVGNYILGGGGFVSRLMHEVREQRGLAYSVYSYFMPMQQAGAFQIGLQTRNDQAEQALQLVRSVLSDFVTHGPTARELTAAKQNIIGGFPLRIDSNRKILDYLCVIGFYQLPLTYLDDFTTRVERVSVSDIRAAFARRINPQALATVVVGGTGAAK